MGISFAPPEPYRDQLRQQQFDLVSGTNFTLSAGRRQGGPNADAVRESGGTVAVELQPRGADGPGVSRALAAPAAPRLTIREAGGAPGKE